MDSSTRLKSGFIIVEALTKSCYSAAFSSFSDLWSALAEISVKSPIRFGVEFSVGFIISTILSWLRDREAFSRSRIRRRGEVRPVIRDIERDRVIGRSYSVSRLRRLVEEDREDLLARNSIKGKKLYFLDYLSIYG